MWSGRPQDGCSRGHFHLAGLSVSEAVRPVQRKGKVGDKIVGMFDTD